MKDLEKAQQNNNECPGYMLSTGKGSICKNCQLSPPMYYITKAMMSRGSHKEAIFNLISPLDSC